MPYIYICMYVVGEINEQRRKKERKKNGTREDDESQRPKNPNGVA